MPLVSWVPWDGKGENRKAEEEKRETGEVGEFKGRRGTSEKRAREI